MSELANPYSPPRSNVRLPEQPLATYQLLAEPRAVPAVMGFKWIGKGWGLMKPDLGMWILMLLTVMVFNILISFLPFIGGIVTTLLSPVFAGGMLMALRGAEQGQRVQFSSLFAGFSTRFAPLLGLGALNLAMWLIVVTCLGVLFWSFFAIYGADVATVDLPSSFSSTAVSLAVLLGFIGFAVISMLLWFATPLVALQDVPVFKALGMSMTACLRNIVPLLLYSLAAFGLILLGILPIGLGLLIVFPLLLAAFYKSYQQIFLK
ncbi:BPSS1780 family membrane protein [uncultured Thiothrix sp.]|uniref:BPSS1780 family membrane protein n=1 Tax=uncultured Thiothrix sp. TaxID=223185 RepID=UPI002608FE56|nr:BPSS1780 family membrane protein [uncultured Thiothrix sp.]HMT94090.1 BPSS1780 family membrane protein [Thiolinea sp.]